MLATRTCRGCGAAFELLTQHQESTRRFCSTPCKQAHNGRVQRAKNPLEAKECLWCGKTYQPKRRDQAYCSRRCRMDVKNERQRKGGLGFKPRKPRRVRQADGAPRVGSDEWAEEQLRRLR